MIVSHQRGTTLMGISIAILIASVLTYYAIQDQSSRRTQIEYSSVIYSASVVGSGLRSYYTQNCSDGILMSSPSVSELITDNHIEYEDSINNRLELTFTTFIENPGTNQSKLIVSTVAPNIYVAAQIADQTVSADSSGSTVNFHYKPLISNNSQNIRFQQMQEYFGDTTCI
jgi:ABC-type uncharacterized transport system substrate-binding protein